MASLLFLTGEERANIVPALPAEIRSAWEANLREEVIDAYETTEELEKRMAQSQLGKSPAVQALIKDVSDHMAEGKSIENISIAGIPDDLVPDFLYSIGASGVSALLQMMLQSPKLKPKDMESIAALSRARHRILQINAVLQ